MLPRLRPSDCLLAVVAIAVAALRWPWWGVRSANSALGLLLTGWDHAAHFDITEMIRRNGTVLHWLGDAPLGDTWSYTRYPQGFHALAATVIEAIAGSSGADPRTEVLHYTQALGLLDIVAAVVLAASVLALPWLHRRSWLAAPAVALVVSTLVLGPGAHLLRDGFPSFTLGTVLLAGLVPLVVAMPRVPDPLRLGAVGGGLVGIAHSWVLLLVIALPVAVLLLVPWRAGRWRATRAGWGVSTVVVVATAAAGLTAVAMVSGESLADVLVIGGAITLPPPRWTAGLVAGAGLGCLAVAACAWRAHRIGGRANAVGRDQLMRAAGLGIVVVVAAALAGGVAALQIRHGELGYYFWKLTVAVGTLAAMVAALTGTATVVEVIPGPVGRRHALVGIGTAVLVTQGYGATAPRVIVPASVAAGPGWTVAEQERAVVSAPPTPVMLQLWAAAAGAPPGSRQLAVLGSGTSATERMSLGQWYNALTGRWTNEANDLLFALAAPAGTAQELASLAGTVLHDPDNVLVVPPELLDATRTAMAAVDGTDGSPGPAADRVVTW